LEEGRASQRKLASLSFDAAGFDHGKPIARNASAQFRYSGVRNWLPDLGGGRFGSKADIEVFWGLAVGRV
jgi:hypothetical protein